MPVNVKTVMQATMSKGGFDNVEPRMQTERFTRENHLAFKLLSAHENGLETLGFMAAVFVGCHLATSEGSAERDLAEQLASVALLSRAAFSVLYAVQQNLPVSVVRTVTWFTCSSALVRMALLIAEAKA